MAAAAAVIENLIVGLISQDALILFKGVDQVKKWLGWQLVRRDGARQGDKNGGRGAAGEAIDRLFAKIHEEAQGFIAVAGLIAKIVRYAAKGIDIAEILPQMFGKQQGDNGEVFVMVVGEEAGLKLRLLGVGNGGPGHLDG